MTAEQQKAARTARWQALIAALEPDETLKRYLESADVDAAALLSIAISLKRIADKISNP